MALGNLTKQLAEQAIRSATAPKPPAPPAPPESMGAVILAQIQAMQKALKEDEELVVLYSAAGETLRVLECFFPSWQVVVVTGTVKDRGVTRVIAPVESVEFVCRVVKAQAGAKPARVTLVTPRVKAE